MASLPEYSLAASTYLCVLQELAVLDPDHQDDPFKSVYCNEVKNKASQFISHVLSTYDKIVQRAKDSLVSTTEYTYKARPLRVLNLCPEHVAPGASSPGGLTLDVVGGWFYDNTSLGNKPDGYAFCAHCGHDKWAYEECGKARDSWIYGKHFTLSSNIYSEMDSLRKIANEEWAKLKTHPLYGCDKMG